MSEEIISIQVMNDKGELKSAVVVNREKAIGRMAVAMCQKSNRTNKCENCISAAKGDCDLKSYYLLAKVALDALIKGE